MTRIFFSLVLLLLFSHPALAASCQKTGSVCVDSTPCKMVGSNKVCLDQLGLSCWNYEDTYTCLKPDAVDYCAAISQVPGCRQTGSVCSATDTVLGSGCMKWTNTWQCDAGVGTPANTVALDTTYTITSDTINASACSSLSANPSCMLASHTCVEPAGTRTIDGLPVYKDCWAWQDDYSCLGPIKSDCADLQNRGCTLSSSKCVSYGTNNTCTLTEHVYSCQDKPASTSSIINCGGSQYCTGGNCFGAGHIPDPDLAKAAAMMEAARQSGNYMDPGSLIIFGGESGSCKNKLGGLSNCCNATGGGAGLNNSSTMGGKILTTAGGQAIVAGSAYMYDVMYNSYAAYQAMAATAATAGSAGAAATMAATATTYEASAYGVTMSYSANAGFTFGFDPTSLAISVAIMVVMDYMACDPPEKMLGMKKGQNLCRFAGSHCSKRLPSGVCIEITENYCCFNSRLARIMNTAGAAQLGRPASDCSGFTPAEFTSIDFSKIDLSEFEAEIMANVQLPSTNAVGTDSASTIQQKLNNYYTRGKQ